MTAKSWHLTSRDERQLPGRDRCMAAASSASPRRRWSLCTGGHQANLDWLRESFGPAADGFMIRGTPYDTGTVLRLLLDAGAKPVGDPARAHMVAVDARGPKFDGGIVTRITAIPHGIVVDRDGRRFHDEGEDARKTHFARWGARIADCPGPDRLSDPGCSRFWPRAADGVGADPGRHHRGSLRPRLASIRRRCKRRSENSMPRPTRPAICR